MARTDWAVLRYAREKAPERPGVLEFALVSVALVSIGAAVLWGRVVVLPSGDRRVTLLAVARGSG